MILAVLVCGVPASAAGAERFGLARFVPLVEEGGRDVADGRDLTVLPSGNVVVVGGARVLEYTPDGAFVRRWPLPEPEYAAPHRFVGVTAGDDGSLYLADRASNEVLRLAPGGTPERIVGDLDQPTAIERRGDELLIADHRSTRRVDLAGRPVAVFLARYLEGFETSAIAATPTSFFTTITPEVGVSQYRLDGSVVRSFLTYPNPTYLQLEGPTGVAADGAGNLWVADRTTAGSCARRPGGTRRS